MWPGEIASGPLHRASVLAAARRRLARHRLLNAKTRNYRSFAVKGVVLYRLLYMAAVAAIRHNPNLGRKYRELRGRGKPPKVALVAVMRKMPVLANALIRRDRLWTAEPVAATATV